MKRTQIEENYRRAVGKITPDVFAQISEACETRRTSLPEADCGKTPARNGYRYRLRRYAAAAAAATVLLLSGVSGSHYYLSGSTTISLDVNPSISLTVNRMNRIVQADALNEDGEIILGQMELKGTDINVAVNALIGAMLKEGYLSELENSVLLSVIDENSEKSSQLEKALTDCIQQAFLNASVEGAVISQKLTSSEEEYRALAEACQISEGKAALAYKVASQTSAMNASDVAALSVNDINLLTHSQNLSLNGIYTLGTASSRGYIGEDKALELAFAYCGFDPEEVHHIQVAMDYNNGKVTYEVEFYYNEFKYEYELDATDGDMLEWESEWKRSDLLAEELAELELEHEIQGIGEEQALSIALEHAGVSSEDVIFSKISTSYEQNTECFEVEFVTAENEYDYDIDASTGDVLAYTHIAGVYE